MPIKASFADAWHRVPTISSAEGTTAIAFHAPRTTMQIEAAARRMHAVNVAPEWGVASSPWLVLAFSFLVLPPGYAPRIILLPRHIVAYDLTMYALYVYCTGSS